jgi:AcrR family transcriptional regulator
LQACVNVVGDQGWQAASVRNICSEARLNPRYFYENFSGLDELLVSVFDQTVGQAVNAIFTEIAIAPPKPAEQAHALFETFLHEMTADPRKARLAFTEAMGSEALMHRRVFALQQLVELVAHQAMQHYPDSGLSQHQAEINAHLLVGGMIEAVAATVEGRLEATQEQLAVSLTRAYMAAYAPDLTGGLRPEAP